MSIREAERADLDGLTSLFGRLSQRDLTVIRESVTDSEKQADLVDGPGERWVEVDEAGSIRGFATLIRLPGWSDHVGELRLVVDPESRGSGVGRRLVQHVLRAGFAAGLLKIMVELATDEDRVLAMFSSLGFTGEALLRDHIRDRDGELRDLIVLAHHVHIGMDALGLTGIADEVG